MEVGCEELVPLIDGGELRLAHDGELFHEAEPAAVGGGVEVGEVARAFHMVLKGWLPSLMRLT